MFGSGLFVGLLYLTLFQTFGDGSAASGENHLDAVFSVVVSRDDEVDVARIRVGINHCKHGDTKALSLFNGNRLFHNINHEECAGQACEDGARAKVLLQFSALARYL